MRRWTAFIVFLTFLALQVSPAGAECDFHSNWDAGSDSLNTGGDGGCDGDDVWDSENDATSILTRSTSTTYGGSAGSLMVNGNSLAYVQKGVTSTATSSARVWVYITAEGLGDGEAAVIARMNYAGTGICWVNLQQTAGALEFQGRVKDYSSTSVNIGSPITGIQLNTGYWLEYMFKANQNEVANAAQFRVWANDGTTQIGTTQSHNSTVNSNVTNHQVGLCLDPTGAITFTIFWDEFKTIDDADTWVGPITASSATGTENNGGGWWF